MMEAREFMQKVRAAVGKRLGQGYQVSVQEIVKNNCVTMQGLIISSREQNVSPTIYLDSFYEAYESGMPFLVVVEKVLDIYKRDIPRENIDMEFFRQFEKVKDRICYRLINREKNQKLLSEIPHMEFLDLAICFYYAYQGEELGDGTILIYNTHMETWGTSPSELFTLAQENSPRLFPWECRGMEEVLWEMTEEEWQEEEEEKEKGKEAKGKEKEGKEEKGKEKQKKEDEEKEEEGKEKQEEGEKGEKTGGAEVPMRVLGNRSHTFGASCILYPGLLEKLVDGKENGFYILPSSIHEVILLDAEKGDAAGGDVRILQKMIEDVNDTQVEPEDILSYSLYYYDCLNQNLRVCSSEIS